MKRKKKKTGKTAMVIASPKNIENISFDEHIDQYKILLTQRQALRKQVRESRAKVLRIVRKYYDDKDNEDLSSGAELLSSYGWEKIEKNITVRNKPKVAEAAEELILLAKEEGYGFDQLAGNGKVLNTLRKMFGEEVVETIVKVGELYCERSHRKDQGEENKKKTLQMRKKFRGLFSEWQESKDQLEDLDASEEDLKKVVGFYKDLASIARVTNGNTKGGE